MSTSDFQWSDQAKQPPASGANRFVWSDEGQSKSNPAPNAGLAPPASPHIVMQPSYVGIAFHPEGSILNPMQPAESFALAHPEQQPILRDAAMVGAFPGGVPELIGAGVGGYAGDKSGRLLTKAAGGGATAQDIAGTVGGIVGGGLGASRLGGGIRGFIKPIVESLGETAPVASAPETILDATGENKPYAGERPPKPAKILDATGENRPFAGGLDEPRAPQPKKSPGQAGSMVQSILSPVESAQPPVEATSEATGAAQSTPAADLSPQAQTILGQLGKNVKTIRAQNAIEAAQPDELSRMLDDPDFLERSIEAVKRKKAAALKAQTIQ
jgi:hypothetical protein